MTWHWPRLAAATLVIACGCGSSSSSSDNDAGMGDGDGGNGDPDGQLMGARTITLTLINRPTNAAQFSFLVAYQDGSAAWKLAPAPAGDKYTFEVSAPVFGVAYACIGNTTGMGAGSLRTVTAAHFAVSERTDVTLDVPSRCTDRNVMGNVTLSGNITNRPTNGLLSVQYGGRSAFVGTQSGNFTLQTPPGTRDLFVIHAVPTGNGDYYTEEVLVVRDLAITANAQRQLDFSAAEQATYYDVTVNASNARVVAGTTLYTANGTSAALVRQSTNWESDALADSQRRTTDVYDQSIAVSTFGRAVTVTNATSTPADQTFTAPPMFGMPMTTAPTKQPYIILESTWPAYTNAVGYTWNATQQDACSSNLACTVQWSAMLSPGVVGTMPAYRMPDLSALAGWKPEFQFASAMPIVGSVTAVTSTAGVADFPTGIPTSGTQRAFVRSDYTLTP